MREKFWKGRLQIAAEMPAKSFSGSGLKPWKKGNKRPCPLLPCAKKAKL